MNKVQKSEEHVLQIKMLGSFSMEYDRKPISFEGLYFSKSIQLFLLLLLHGEAGIKKDTLMEYLYRQAKGPKVNNNLNNMVSRLRKQLQELGLPEEDHIEIKGGRCRYVSSSRIKVDVQELEAFLMKAEDPETAPRERRACLLEAVRRYQGELLPKLSPETWVEAWRMRCKKLYEAALNQLGQILSEEADFKTLYPLYAQAAGWYPLEGWEEKIARCLTAMGQKERAARLYQETTRLYREQLGIAPAEQTQKRQRELENKLYGCPKSLDLIQQELHEEKREPGAYYLSFPSFLDSSRVMARLMEREGKEATLLICTLEEGIPEERKEKTERETSGRIGAVRTPKREGWLRRSICSSLRREDIYTRYSPCQYLALLMGTGPEDACGIISRIDQRYQELSKSKKKEIRYEITAPKMEQEKNRIWEKSRKH